jgi:hypothetical protein
MAFTCFNIVNAYLAIFTGSSDVLVLLVKLNRVYFGVWLTFGEMVCNVDVTVWNDLDSKINHTCTDVI